MHRTSRDGEAPSSLDPTTNGYYGILSQWVVGCADVLLWRVAADGWTNSTIAEANALTGTIIEAWGPGNYTIRLHEYWHEPQVRQWIEGLPQVRASASRRR